MQLSDLDTPALVIDLDIMERNLRRVQDYASAHRLRLRPHTKTHKTPALGRKQLELGAVGLTVAKTTEAEVMMSADPPDLLIAYPVVGSAKLQRLASLAKRTAVTVSLDSQEAIAGLAEAAEELGFHAGVLVELDAGLHRVGVTPGPGLLQMARQVLDAAPHLEFRGISFYPGHVRNLQDGGDAALTELGDLLSHAVGQLESERIPVPVISGGSTPTLFSSHRISGLNEIRPGTYIFNDRNTWLTGACTLDDCAVSISATVVSTAVPGQVIVDGGSKTFSSDRSALPDHGGFGYIREAPDAVFTKMNEEHGFIDVRAAGSSLRVGDRVRIIPNHVCVAVNLHEKIYGVRGDTVEEVWRVEGRGQLQ